MGAIRANKVEGTQGSTTNREDPALIRLTDFAIDIHFQLSI